MNTRPPITTITQQHIGWWNNLPELWQKIFCLALYQPDIIEMRLLEDYSSEFIANDDKFGVDEGIYILNYSPVLRDINDLLNLFKVKQIVFDRELNPSSDTVVTFIPPMRYFTELEFLSLNYNYLKDISNLSSLTTLKSLSLCECFTIDDYSPIANLTNLVELELGFNGIKDICFVENLTELRHLYLPGNRIANISAISGLAKLITLDLGSSPIRDVRPLAKLIKLQELSMGTDEPTLTGEFDYTHVKWLKEQLSNTDIDVY